ncbi:MAG: biliverdin-producing heme oxygenase [Gammaproteobacteria bacterium]|nr:biliverdin-producing heme oxygenase [Gammaproteobacteria bacterium]
MTAVAFGPAERLRLQLLQYQPDFHAENGLYRRVLLAMDPSRKSVVSAAWRDRFGSIAIEVGNSENSKLPAARPEDGITIRQGEFDMSTVMTRPQSVRIPSTITVANAGLERSRQPFSICVALRKVTALHHERVELLMPVSRESVGLPEYLEFLGLMAEWVAQIECWIGHHPSTGIWQSRLPFIRRYSRLVADLEASEHPVPRTMKCHFSAIALWPQDEAFYWGVRYVIEGSRLGGRMLYRKLSEQHVASAMRFLAEDELLAQQWRDLRQVMEVRIRSMFDLEVACTGAVAAFGMLEDHVLSMTAADAAPACRQGSGDA